MDDDADDVVVVDDDVRRRRRHHPGNLRNRSNRLKPLRGLKGPIDLSRWTRPRRLNENFASRKPGPSRNNNFRRRRAAVDRP